jgi:hypothetical protein
MDSQDIIRTGHKAKNETEAFINRYLNDQAKGWPRVCFCSSVYNTEYPQDRQAGPALRAAVRNA